MHLLAALRVVRCPGCTAFFFRVLPFALLFLLLLLLVLLLFGLRLRIICSWSLGLVSTRSSGLTRERRLRWWLGVAGVSLTIWLCVSILSISLTIRRLVVALTVRGLVPTVRLLGRGGAVACNNKWSAGKYHKSDRRQRCWLQKKT